jgi:MFS family permease
MATAIPASHNRIPFVALLVATGVSIVGTMFTTLSVPWFVLQTTGSPTKTGITGAVTALSFLAALFGGTLVDRMGFKRASVAADLASGIAVALIPLLYHTIGLTFWQLLLLVFLRAFCNTPGGTARMGLLPDLIALAGMGKERANGIYQSVQYAAQLAGTASVGILIALIGTSNILWLDGVSFLVSATIVFLAIPNTRHEPATQPRPRGDYRGELMAGLRWLARDRVLTATTFTATLINLIGTMLIAVALPVFAKTVYGSSVALGLLFTGFSVGTLAGSLAYTAVGARIPRRATFVGGVLLVGLPLAVLAVQPPLLISATALAVVGFFNGPLNAVFSIIEQARIPAAMRGRVFGAIIALANIAAPIGALMGGLIVSGVGVRGTFLCGATALVGIGVWAACSRALHQLDADPGHGIG